MRTAIVVALSIAFQSPLALEQTAAEPRNETLITLGTEGGPVPHGKRSGIATLLQVNGKSYLFDAGNGVTRQLVGAGVKLIEVQKIFLTHLHDDHCSGLAAFVGELWTNKPENPVDIYGHEVECTIRRMKRYGTQRVRSSVVEGLADQSCSH
jgi:ribonuclease BN (tRNA processing enzyme)